MDAVQQFEVNLEALEALKDTSVVEISDREFRRFYHRVVIQCAKRMNPAAFKEALEHANISLNGKG